jgi:aspartyl protease family protein
VSDNAPYIVFYVLAAVFVASSLIGRRLPVGQTVKLALAWVAIFVAAIAIAVFLRAYL